MHIPAEFRVMNKVWNFAEHKAHFAIINSRISSIFLTYLGVSYGNIRNLSVLNFECYYFATVISKLVRMVITKSQGRINSWIFLFLLMANFRNTNIFRLLFLCTRLQFYDNFAWFFNFQMTLCNSSQEIFERLFCRNYDEW